MKPKYATARLQSQALVTAIVVCFGASFAQGAESSWTGATNSQWNDASNWTAGIPTKSPGLQDAVINTNTGNIATITLGIIPPQSILVGRAATGILNHPSGDAVTGSTNQMHVGQDGGNGTYNLADTAGTGGLYTGLGTGTGSMNVNAASLFIGGFSGTGSTGKVNVNTTGLLAVGGDIELGTNSSSGTLNIDSGTVSGNGWIEIGNGGSGGAACSGTLRMSGGSLTKTGSNHMIVGANGSVGTATINGGSININNEIWVGNNPNSNGTLTLTTGTVTSNSWFAIGRNSNTATGKVFVNGGTLNKAGGGNFVIGDSGNGELNQTAGSVTINGELWIGQNGSGVGKLAMSGGTLTVNNWVAVGRGGNGTFNLSGGTFTKSGGGNFLVCGAGTGTMNMTGGTLDVTSGEIQIPEGGNGTMNVSGASSEIRGNTVRVGTNGGSTGNLNLNGGTLRATQIIGGSGATRAVAFNGTQIIAKAASTTFISNLTAATVNSGGLKIDSNNFGVTIPQLLIGTGGVVKSGIGTLTLTGANTNTGPTDVLEGKLFTTTASDSTGAVTLSDSTAFGLTQTVINDVYNTSTFTFGFNDDSLNFDLGAFAGNTTSAPLNVTGPAGALTVNGDVVVNVADTNIVTGSIPLISYTGLKAGSGNFNIGTLPDGVVANLVLTDTAGASSLALNVTRANDPYWTGTTNSLWNTADANWKNEFGGVATNYADGDPAMFDDRVATGPTTVVLNTTVTPGGSGVTFNNTAKNYVLSGTGNITGATGLLKLGTGSLDITTANDYDGNTTITAGTINVATLANAGVASPISKDGLFLNGGTLNYTGATTTIDRGFNITGGTTSGITTTNDLTLTGPVSGSGGSLTKLGTGTLTLTNDTIVLGGPATKVNQGTLSLIGSGSQVVTTTSDLWVGAATTTSGNIVLQNTTLNIGAWFALGRGNGNTGITSTMTATGSTIQCTNVSTGFNGDLPTNSSIQTVTLNNTAWTTTQKTLLGESQTATTNMTLSGTSSYTASGQFQMALNATAIANITIQDNSSVSNHVGWFSIGDRGTATVIVKGNGQLNTTGIDLNVTDNASAVGTLKIQDNATVTAGTFFWGKGASTTATVEISGGTFNGGISEIAQNASSNTTITQTGGVANFGNNDRMWFAQGGHATWNQSAGQANSNGWLVIGRGTGSVGAWNVSGGTLKQTTAGQGLILAEQGTGTLTISGTGVVEAAGGQVDIATGGGNGTLNLNAGGTLIARQVIEHNSGTSAVNFNGGTLVANSSVQADLMTGIDTATINAGGATIDSNGQSFIVSQSFQGSGNLVKTGAGSVALDGVSTFTGSTTVSAGALGGTGTVAGALVVSPGATLAPGHSVGTFTAGASTISGTYACEVSGATADKLVANGTLNVSAATLAITEVAPASGSALVIASYTGATPAPFASVTGLPAGYSVVYNYGGNQIALVSASTPYGTWAQNNITAINPGADATPGGDPDGDGSKNIAEFALNGNPLSGASSGKVVGKVASVGGSPTLVLTLPVRTGATFSGATEQVSALIDGVVYKVQGSDELANWNLAVSEVTGGDKTIIETGLPALDTGWTYRTFQSPGTITGDPADFLRAIITAP